MADQQRLSVVVQGNSELESLIALRDRLAREIDRLGVEDVRFLSSLSSRLVEVLARIEAVGGAGQTMVTSPLDELTQRRTSRVKV